MTDRERTITHLKAYVNCYADRHKTCNQNCALYGHGDCVKYFIESINDALELLKERETVSGWVSVEDRLPEEDTDVLVWNELGIEIAAYTTNPVKRWYSYTGQKVFAKYWMPLPKPAQEESDNA